MSAIVLFESVERFQREGYLHCRALLGAEEARYYAEVVNEAVRARKQHDTRDFSQKSHYEQSFIQCQYLWEDVPPLRGLTFHPRICETAAALLGVRHIRLWHDQALYKEPGGRETEAHQDHPYWPIAETDTITAWIALSGTDEETGCMGYLPGSHLGVLDFVDIFKTPGDSQRLLDRYPGASPVFASCEPGDVIFHHGRTVHMAKPNRSKSVRRAYTVIYFRDGCTRSATGSHPSVDRDSILPGALINGQATPVAWPLPNQEMPQPGRWPQAADERSLRSRTLGIIPRQ